MAMPASPSKPHPEAMRAFFFMDEARHSAGHGHASRFYSHLAPAGSANGRTAAAAATKEGAADSMFVDPECPNNERFRDKRFDSFKTWSGRLERQISNFRGRPPEVEDELQDSPNGDHAAALPVDRYFDALQGPELDTLKVPRMKISAGIAPH